MYKVKVIVEDAQGRPLPQSLTLAERSTAAGAMGFVSALATVSGAESWYGDPEVDAVKAAANRVTIITNAPAHGASDAGFWKALGLDAGDGDDWIVTR